MKIRILHHSDARFDLIRHLILGLSPGAEVVGEKYSERISAQALFDSAPDILVLDETPASALKVIESLNLMLPGVDVLQVSPDTDAEFLMLAMRSGVREVIPSAAGPDGIRAAVTRILQKRQKQTSNNEGKVFAFLSCKGGSGATFLATNFAYVLATEYGKKVALLDLNLQFGDASMFVSEVRPPSNLAELAQQIHRLDASLLAASMLEAAPNFHVLAAPDKPEHSVDVQREHIEAIVRVAKRHYDFVIVDLPRSLNSLSLQVLDMADTIFPVMQLTLPFVRDGKRLLSVFHSLDYPRSKVRVVVNRYEKGGEFSLQDLEQAIDERVAYVVPNSYRAAAASVNLGIPIAKGNRNDPISKLLIEMGREVAGDQESSSSTGWFSRLFTRGSAA